MYAVGLPKTMSEHRPFQFVKLTRSQIGLIAVMSVLAPLLAFSIQTAWILTYGLSSRYYTAIFYPFDNNDSWITPCWTAWIGNLAVPALITFLLVSGFMKLAPRMGWPTWLVCCALWTYAAFTMVAVVSG